jgi:hypothetical protein
MMGTTTDATTGVPMTGGTIDAGTVELLNPAGPTACMPVPKPPAMERDGPIESSGWM